MWIKADRLLEITRENVKLSGESGYFKGRLAAAESENARLKDENTVLKAKILKLEQLKAEESMKNTMETPSKGLDLGVMYDELMNGKPDEVTGKVRWTDGRD